MCRHEKRLLRETVAKFCEFCRFLQEKDPATLAFHQLLVSAKAFAKAGRKR